MPRDHRDLCIEALAEELIAMTERANVAISDRDVWKEMSLESLRQWHRALVDNARLRSQAFAHRARVVTSQRNAA